jgi:hypothetical protein
MSRTGYRALFTVIAIIVTTIFLWNFRVGPGGGGVPDARDCGSRVPGPSALLSSPLLTFGIALIAGLLILFYCSGFRLLDSLAPMARRPPGPWLFIQPEPESEHGDGFLMK